MASSPLLVACFSVVFSYLFALAGELALGSEILLGVLLLASLPGAFALAFRRKENPELLESARSPAVALTALLLYFAYLATKKITVSTWDEFSHWGLVIKEVLNYHNLLGINSAVSFKEYPPGNSLFVYFFARFFDEGEPEGTYYFCQSLWILTSCVFCLRNLRWRKFDLVLMVLAGVLFFQSLRWLGYEPFSLYVDVTLGLLFGAILMTARDFEKTPAKAMLQALPIVMTLPLIKFSGSFFALTGTFFVTLFYFSSKNQLRLKDTLFVLLSSGVLITGIFFSKLSWKSYYESEGINLVFKTQAITPLRILHSFSEETATARDKITISNFGHALFNFKYGLGAGDLNTVQWFIILALLSFFSIFLAAKKPVQEGFATRRSRWVLQVTLILGALFYVMGLLSLYLYTFGEYDGTTLTSFQRYTGTFFVAWFAVLIYWFVEDLPKLWEFTTLRKWISLGLLVTLGFAAKPALEIAQIVLKPEVRRLERREQVHEFYLKSLTPFMRKPANYFLIWQNTGGFEYVINRFEIWPQRLINERCYSLGPKYYENDFWTCNLSIPELEQALRRADYVIRGEVDERFWQNYGKIFDIYEEDKNCRLFQRVKRADGHFKLIPIW